MIGVRVGEAIGPYRTGFDPDSGVLTIRDASSGRPVKFPLHPSTTGALVAYTTPVTSLWAPPGVSACPVCG